MLHGYKYMLENFDLSNVISCHYLRNLHQTCMFNVYSTLSESAPGDLRCEETGFKFFASRTTIEFFKELFEIRKNDNIKLFHNGGVEKPARNLNIYDVYQKLMKRKRLQFNPWYPELDKKTKDNFEQKGTLVEFYEAKTYIQLQFAKKMEEIVEKFNKILKIDCDDNERINQIAKFVQEIELLHPFPDGNCRTFVTLTNHLLIYHGLYPTILENPNYDGTYSYQEYAYEIRKGIEATKQLLSNPEMTLYGYNIKSASSEELKKFEEMSLGLVKAIDNLEVKKETNIAIKDENIIYITPEFLTRITGGKWLNYDSSIKFSGVGTHGEISKGYLSFGVGFSDMRKQGIEENIIIDKLKEIFIKGANAIVVDREEYSAKLTKPILVVDDVTAALRKVAIAVREEVNPKTVLIAGTVGKTGFKFQLNHCLKSLTNTHSMLNSGNIKLPILYSLSSLKADDKVEIVEVSGAAKYSWGASRSNIISPDICIFTDLGNVHMDIHKTVENLIKNKASAVDGIRKNGICIVNNDAQYANELIDVIKDIRDDINIVTFGNNNSDAFIVSKIFDKNKFGWDIIANICDEKVEYFTPLFHNHAPVQSLGILLTVKKLGYDIQKASKNYLGLKLFQTMGRLFELTKDDNSKFLFYDQSLRGSIQGMKSAFEDIKNFSVKGKVIAILGGSSIEEDGEFTKEQHEAMAELINNSVIDKFYTIGPYLNYMNDKLNDNVKNKLVMHSENRVEIVNDLSKDLQDGDLVFVMGSAYLRLGDIGAKILTLGKRREIV